MRVLLDTNVVLDVLLVRAPFVETSSQVWQAVDDGSIEGYVLASAVTDIFYLARKQVGLETAHKAKQFARVSMLLKSAQLTAQCLTEP